ncbi:hypothetical protein HRbin36_02019 [bacterium HR36]|nr:hypothetical protein HRbin36_02019 [bacterium HR36]
MATPYQRKTTSRARAEHVDVRKWQLYTLAHLVAAAICVGRVSLAEPNKWQARQRQGLVQHAIKRVWWFIANTRVRRRPGRKFISRAEVVCR